MSDDAGPAYIVLAHDRLPRVGGFLARLAAHGAPVALHLDRRADARPLREALGGAPVIEIPRRRADWGGFGLVTAALDGLRLLRESGRPHSHVLLLSGADLQLRPESELRGFLAGHPGVDFIESVDPTIVDWGRGGFTVERFTLRHPVSWKRRRALHERLCTLQRRWGLRRGRPAVAPPLVPRLGSQWWCVSAASRDALLDAPELERALAWHRLVFIPDEAFFATMIPRVAARPPDPRGPLSFARFDPAGRPYALYDDHAEALAASDHFFARKPWAGARLDDSFPRPQGHARFEARPPTIDFARIEARAETPPRGLRHPGRAPALRIEGLSALPRPCKALAGLDLLWGPAIRGWIAARSGAAVHGRVFAEAPPGPRFEHGDTGPGGLSITPALLRAAPERLASAFVAAHRERLPVFLLDPQDQPAAVAALAEDPMCDLLLLRGAWAFAPQNAAPAAARIEDARIEDARAEAAERALIDRVRAGRLTLLDPWRALATPGETLRAGLKAARVPLDRDDGAPPPPFLAPAEEMRARLLARRAAGRDLPC